MTLTEFARFAGVDRRTLHQHIVVIPPGPVPALPAGKIPGRMIGTALRLFASDFLGIGQPVAATPSIKMEILRKRLQIQTQGRAGIDRLIVYAVGQVAPVERSQLRGVVFECSDKIEALDLHRDLRKLAQEAVAKNEINRFLDALDKRSRTTADDSPTFDKFSGEWETNCVLGGGLAESMVSSDQSILKLHLRPFFGKMKVSEIGMRDIDRYKAAKRQEEHQYGTGYSGKALNNHVGTLSRILRKAVDYGLIEKSPITRGAWSKKERTPEDGGRAWWTPSEEERAVASLDAWRATDPLARMAILTSLVIGCRFSELRSLEKSDIDFQAPGIWIRRSQARKKIGPPKSKRSRFQPIPRVLADELREFMLRIQGQRLFPGRKGGPLANNMINRWFAKLCAEAKIRVITSHGARHTAGSSYAMSGVGQKMIARLLGHLDTGTTERYTHVQADGAGALVEARWARLRPVEGSK
jgi:integrase